MKKPFTLSSLCAGVCLSVQGFAQQPTTLSASQGIPVTGQVFKKKLPDDLPQAKLLFIKFLPVKLPASGPKGWGAERRLYFMQKNHNDVIPEANKQLVEAAARYPYAHRITTSDSIAYYRDQQGYKYMLMQSSFTAATDGSFRGTTSHGSGTGMSINSTSVDLYVQDLNSGDKYVFDDFSETFIYYYKGQVGMLLKKTAKQFTAKK
ncbi:hypothetical protein [Hymenobacter terricola]|uniref:hypothetical protein n=1 Tax=Hymenobacter terricola TaxID=2819236 RepID=UPI001B30BEEF|nr:hypothetical protein [Hymenobacter terricola]